MVGLCLRKMKAVYLHLQCERTVPIGGEVDSLLLVSGYLIVGFHTQSGEGVLKVWNMATAADHILAGHQVQTCLLDGRTRLWDCLLALLVYALLNGLNFSPQLCRFSDPQVAP